MYDPLLGQPRSPASGLACCARHPSWSDARQPRPGFPAVLGHTAQATSPCRATGDPVHLTATPDGPTNMEPATAMVSIVTPDAPTTVRASFCNQIHFFAGVDAGADPAKGWLDQHPVARVLPVADAYDVERPLIEQIHSRTAETGCC
ncbi:organomercurial lyase [Streptomyces sp. NBC_01483]|uniref:organomercurial lyase n=1 Tax=Streptomyces sp. NBC_01483 TaxID=2903883 RepID=UPI00324CC5EA